MPVCLDDEVRKIGRFFSEHAHDAGAGVLRIGAIPGLNRYCFGDVPKTWWRRKTRHAEEYLPSEEPLAEIEPGQALRVRARLAIVIDDWATARLN